MRVLEDTKMAGLCNRPQWYPLQATERSLSSLSLSLSLSRRGLFDARRDSTWLCILARGTLACARAYTFPVFSVVSSGLLLHLEQRAPFF